MSELVKYRNLIRELVSRDIKKKYRRSVLGILWSLLNPLFMMLITAAVFSNLFRFDIRKWKFNKKNICSKVFISHFTCFV